MTEGSAGFEPIRHGYSLADIGYFAREGVRTAWAQASPYAERYQAAWMAVVERLAESDEAPRRGELIWSGQQGVNELVREYRHAHGFPSDGVSASTEFRVSFQRYWWLAIRAQPNHAGGVDERIAVNQIMETLAPAERNAVEALAACDDYAAAAKLLGVSKQAFHNALSRARRKFFALWHEGETPSSMWGRDRRKWRQDVDEVAEHRSVMVRKRAAWRRQAKEAA